MHPDAIHAREIKLAIPYAAYEAPDGKLKRFGELWPRMSAVGLGENSSAARAAAGIFPACFVHGRYQVVGRASFARIPVWRGPRCLSPRNACGYEAVGVFARSIK